jgi:hypothetical protein
MTGDLDPIEGVVRPRRPLLLRGVSPALFAAILIAFALPFGTVSCEGPPVSFTGYELATWRVQQTSSRSKTDEGQPLSAAIEDRSSGMAFLMLTCALAGLVLGLANRLGAGIATSAGLTATALLWMRVVDPGLFSPAAQPGIGFELASAFYVALAIWHIALRSRRRRFASAVTRHDGPSVR